MPTRAMVGTRWSGREQCWRHAPRDYGAIHFHADDLGDCDWQADFTWTVPDDLRSGAYALHLTCDAGEDWLPLYVLPSGRGRSRRSRSWLRRSPIRPTPIMRAPASTRRITTASPHGAPIRTIPTDYPIYGRSTYNKHRDGSGIAFSSRHRPILTMRPGFLTFNDPRGSGMRHYPADLHLLAWLEAKGFEFDIVTDEDLDDEGVGADRAYRAVLTGSHPEYHTLGTLDALTAYTAGRQAVLSRRQRLLLAGRARQGDAAPDRAAPRGGRHPHLGRRAGRILSPDRRPVGRAVAAQPPAAADAGGRRLLLPGGIRGHALPPPAGLARSALRLDVRRHRGGRARRLRPVRRRRRGLRTGSRRSDARHARRHGDPGAVGEPAAVLPHRAGGIAVQHDHASTASRSRTCRAARSCISTRRPAGRCSPWARSPSAAACGGTGSKARSRGCWRMSCAAFPGG